MQHNKPCELAKKYDGKNAVHKFNHIANFKVSSEKVYRHKLKVYWPLDFIANYEVIRLMLCIFKFLQIQEFFLRFSIAFQEI